MQPVFYKLSDHFGAASIVLGRSMYDLFLFERDRSTKQTEDYICNSASVLLATRYSEWVWRAELARPMPQLV